MEIARENVPSGLILRCQGRMDASWSGVVEEAVNKSVREGHHVLFLDLSQITYLSSAGIRVILTGVKLTAKIGGRMTVVHPSANVAEVLRMAGLRMIIDEDFREDRPTPPPPRKEEEGRHFLREDVRFEAIPLAAAEGFQVSLYGAPDRILQGSPFRESLHCVDFFRDSVAVGLGELGEDPDVASRCGEFLSLCGTAIYAPPESAETPDFLLAELGHPIQAVMTYGVAARGAFSHLLRFEANTQGGDVPLSSLVRACFDVVDSEDLVVAAALETAALVGGAFRRDSRPAPALDLSFPAIREHLSFTVEPAFLNTSALVAGFASRGKTSPTMPFLRPISVPETLYGHFHAAVFPYRPIRKGVVELHDVIARLFEDQGVKAVLHLIHDSRPLSGSGESRFFRGACWVGPVVGFQGGESS